MLLQSDRSRHPSQDTESYASSSSITFIDEDAGEIQTPYDDATVISLIIVNYEVKCILVDNESSTDV